jgi:hypothetical protein
MQYSAPVDGFRIAYERSGSGSGVVLLHGWPGDHTDWDHLVDGLPGPPICYGRICAALVNPTSTKRILKRSTRAAGKPGPSPHLWTNLG